MRRKQWAKVPQGAMKIFRKFGITGTLSLAKKTKKRSLRKKRIWIAKALKKTNLKRINNKIMITEKQKNRFWNKVEKTDNCWNYTGYTDCDGYGIFYAGKNFRAHRFSALLAGKDTSKPIIRHLCNNPSCVNPEHLEPGTQFDNMQDMRLSNRQNYTCGGKKKIPVITPMGEFESVKAAARAHKIDATTVMKRLKDGIKGWVRK